MNTITEESQKLLVSDQEVISRVLAGEHRLYEFIMRRYNARLYRIGMSIVNNDTEVEDIMQVTYIKAYEHLHTFNNKSAFGTWITRILINESLLHLKKSKRYMSMETNNETNPIEKVQKNESSPIKALLNKELSNVLEDALVQLPEKYRIVFVLREMENMSIAETVDTLSITEANVKVRLNRAKAMLRDTLGDYYKNDGIYHFHLTRCDRIVNNVFRHLGIATSA
jgi:RNA polymerase sigma factor (sigma-70 family)